MSPDEIMERRSMWACHNRPYHEPVPSPPWPVLVDVCGYCKVGLVWVDHWAVWTHYTITEVEL